MCLLLQFPSFFSLSLLGEGATDSFQYVDLIQIVRNDVGAAVTKSFFRRNNNGSYYLK